MTDKEKRILRKIKNDPGDFMFDMLFKKNEQDEVIPIYWKKIESNA